MAFIAPFEVKQLKEKMTSDLSQLGKIYKAKNNDYQLKSVDHNLVEDLVKSGWEEYGLPLKTKTKLRKLKTHDVKFEDDMWCQLYRLGYRNLNFDRKFVLPYGKAEIDKKQIDVIAVNEDSILIVECRSSAKPKKAPSLKTEFEGLKLRLNGFNKSLEQIFGKGRKVKYIFATRNLRLDRESEDIQRLIKTDSFFYNNNTYEYVDALVRSYRDAAKYQFHAMLFRDKLINKEKIEVPAIEGKMGGKTYYMFSLEPHLLLKMGFVLHRTRANESELPTYQRLLVPSRLKGIGKFLDNDGYFPNSILLNFSNKTNKIRFEAAARGKSTISRHGILKIPNAYAIAYIIDGQHRVYGYASSDYKENNTIPVVAFSGLTSGEQLELFMQINENQKAVSPTLRITLEEDLFWNSDRTDSRIKALRSSIIRVLSGDIASPLYGKISIGEDKAQLSAKPFATVLVKSGLLPAARGNKYISETTDSCLYNTNNLDHNSEMIKAQKRIVGFLNRSYEYMNDTLSGSDGLYDEFILSNRGTFAFISLLGSIHTHEVSLGNIKLATKLDDRFSRVEKYLKAFAEELINLPDEEFQKLTVQLGAKADILWFRSFQELVNNRFSSYEPSDLVDWKERQDKELQATGREFGTDIEKYMKKTIIAKLKVLFGDDWDIEIGPIQRQCDQRAKEQMEKNYREGLGRKEINWTEQFFITDYKKIIETYWTRRPENDEGFKSFSEIFSIDIGLGNNSKAEKVKWISRFNSLRNNWAHEGTKEIGLNKDEVNLLKQVYEHLYVPG